MATVMPSSSGEAAAHPSQGGGGGKDPRGPTNLQSSHAGDFSLEMFGQPMIVKLVHLRWLYNYMKSNGGVPKGFPKNLATFLDDNDENLPVDEVQYRRGYSDAKISCTPLKYPNHLTALFGMAAASAYENEGEDACDGCKSKNGRFQGCIVVQDGDTEAFDGACMNCLFASSSAKCSLSQKEIKHRDPSKSAKVYKDPYKVTMTNRFLAVPLKPKASFNTVKGAAQILQDLTNYHNELARRLVTGGKGYLQALRDDPMFEINDLPEITEDAEGDEQMEED